MSLSDVDTLCIDYLTDEDIEIMLERFTIFQHLVGQCMRAGMTRDEAHLAIAQEMYADSPP